MGVKISVIIPTYKPDYTLYECLDSLNNQSFDKNQFEILLILNGDRNPYEQEISNYISTSLLKINYFYCSEKGVSYARNFGIKVANGEYITFIDSDDWVSENYLDGLLKKTNNNQMALAELKYFNNNSKIFFNNYFTKLYDSLIPEKKYKHIYIKSYFSCPVGKLLPTYICRKTSFEKKFNYGEDGLFMFSIEPFLPLGIKSDDNVIYFRRCIETSLSHKPRKCFEIVKIHISLLIEYWKIYLKNITKYNFVFFMNRNMAIIKHIILGK
ncbi:MAG: glycosyltransferase family 2 protein [Spirochaetaceae bacterium]|nr:glycosyltransferase family 2 protein [Spirochaetaceae bacterium]